MRGMTMPDEPGADETNDGDSTTVATRRPLFAATDVVPDRLSLSRIAEYWSKSTAPSADYERRLGALLSGFWAGAFDGDAAAPSSVPLGSRETLATLSELRKSIKWPLIIAPGESVQCVVRDGNARFRHAPPRGEPGGLLEAAALDIRPRLLLSPNAAEWTDEEVRAAVLVLQERAHEVAVGIRYSVHDDYDPRILSTLISIKISKVRFETWLRAHGYELPAFWRRDREDAGVEPRPALAGPEKRVDSLPEAARAPTSRNISERRVDLADHAGVVPAQKVRHPGRRKGRNCYPSDPELVEQAVNMMLEGTAANASDATWQVLAKGGAPANLQHKTNFERLRKKVSPEYEKRRTRQ